ncbi:hypothetical protein ABZP36_009127 [Zizania latifolia]
MQSTAVRWAARRAAAQGYRRGRLRCDCDCDCKRRLYEMTFCVVVWGIVGVNAYSSYIEIMAYQKKKNEAAASKKDVPK